MYWKSFSLKKKLETSKYYSLIKVNINGLKKIHIFFASVEATKNIFSLLIKNYFYW